MRRAVASLLTAASLAAAPAVLPRTSRAEALAPAPKLELPLACTLGRNCWIQHYVDRTPDAAPHDYRCGGLTYHQHNGVDIRIPDMAAERAGVKVLAAADGRVLRTRDGMADVSVRTTGLEAVEGIECGNGLVIQHAGGLETQYCHLAKGSLVVKPGDDVKAGQPLGRVGLSGETEFPHLHFTVRRAGVVVDPFAPDAPPPGAASSGPICGSGQSLWRQTPSYVSRTVINAGFADRPVDMAAVEGGEITRPAAAAPYVVAYVRTLGLKAGDAPSLVLFGPGGEVWAPSPPFIVKSDQDQRILFVGKRRPEAGWPRGVYRARYLVRAKGEVVLQRDFALTLAP